MSKYTIAFLLFFGLGFTTIAQAQTFYVTPETYKYDNDISFTISKITQLRKIQTGPLYFTPEKGYKVIEVWVNITNNSKDTKTIDFESFSLIDTAKRIRHPAKYSMGEGLTGTEGRMQPTIGKGETKNRKLVFGFPQDVKPDMLMVNGTLYQLHYTDKPPQPANTDSSDDN